MYEKRGIEWSYFAFFAFSGSTKEEDFVQKNWLKWPTFHHSIEFQSQEILGKFLQSRCIRTLFCKCQKDLFCQELRRSSRRSITPIFCLLQAEERILLRMKKVSSSVSLKKLFSALLMKKKLYSGRRRNLTQENCTVEMEATSFVGPDLMRLGLLQKIFLLSSS